MRASVRQSRPVYYTAEVHDRHATLIYQCSHQHEKREDAAVCAKEAKKWQEPRHDTGAVS